MSVTVGQILELLNGIAPFELAEEWDNVGLLAGCRSDEVECVLCALDFSEKVLDEAIADGAQMIVTHHPILFRGRQNLCGDDPEGKLLLRLVRSGISLASAHTNFDNVHPGVNDVLAEKLGLKDIRPMEHGMCIGTTKAAALWEFRAQVEMLLGGVVRMYGEPERVIEKVAVLGGAGEDFIPDAVRAGADVYITGEVGYHKALSAVDEGMCVLEAGHAATENPAILMLAGALQNAANDVQYNVRVLCSAVKPFL